MKRSLTALLTCIFLLSAGIRLWGINHHINTDENKVVNPSSVLAKAEQDPLLYPKGSYYPHFYHYVLGAIFWPYTFFETDDVASGSAGAGYYTTYMLIARIVTALIGAGTVVGVYFVGRQLIGSTGGILSALFLAVLPLHVKYSHYAHVDIPLTAMGLLATWTSIRLWQTGEKKWYLLTGIAVGLSAATHYPGFALGILLVFAHARWIWISSEKLKTLFRPAFIAALFLIPLTFAIASPYSVFDWKKTAETYRVLNQRALTGDLGYTRTDMFWPLYTKTPDWGLPFTRTGLMWEMHPFIFVIALFGAAVAIAKKRWDILILCGGTALILYLSITGYVRMTAVKRLLPLTPLLVILAAYAITTVADTLRGRGKISLVILITTLGVGLAGWEVIGFNVAYSGGSTHETAVVWAENNIPHGSTVLQHTPIMLLGWGDERFNPVRLDEVYASFNPKDPEVSHDRAQSLDTWVTEEGVEFVVLDSRIVDRYYDTTSMRLYPETTASYQTFFNDVRRRGTLVHEAIPELWKIAGPRVEIYDVRSISSNL